VEIVDFDIAATPWFVRVDYHLLTEGVKYIIPFRIAHNRIAELAAWDEQLLGEEFQLISEMAFDFKLEITGFELPEIEVLIENVGKVAPQADPADHMPPPPKGPSITVPGDLWQLGGHRIYCGDARDPVAYNQLMDAERASMIFTDAPYNVKIEGNVSGLGKTHHPEFAMASGEMSKEEFTGFLRSVMERLAEHSVDGSLHYHFMDWRHMSEILVAGHAVYSEMKNLCVWVKPNGGMGSMYRSRHELVFVFKHGTARHQNNIELGRFGRNRTNVWEYDGANSFGRQGDDGNLLEFHPTAKNVKMVADAILDASSRNEIVLDPFLGSGTTLLAAERTRRICRGVEYSTGYVDVAIRRWQALTGENAVLIATGRTFTEIEQNGRTSNGV
jgi:DNA modification methylase